MLQLQNPVYDLLYLTFNWNTVMKPYRFALGETNGQTLLTPTMSSEFRILSAADRCELLNQYSAERESDPIAADTWWFSKSWIKLRLWAESLLDSRKWALIARQCQIPSAARRSARSRPSALEYISTVPSLFCCAGAVAFSRRRSFRCCGLKFWQRPRDVPLGSPSAFFCFLAIDVDAS